MKAALFGLLFFAATGYGLDCYQCNTAIHDNCAPKSKLVDSLKETCPYANAYCVRSETTTQGQTTVSRTCSPIAVNMNNICAHGVCTTSASCTTDGCNHSNGKYIINHFLALVGLCLAFFLTR